MASQIWDLKGFLNHSPLCVVFFLLLIHAHNFGLYHLVCGWQTCYAFMNRDVQYEDKSCAFGTLK